jgi:hypothetical protein
MTEQPQRDDLRDAFIFDPLRKQPSVDPSARNLAWYTVIEQWWGESLDLEQADRIAGAPLDHISRFVEDTMDTTSPRLAKRALYEPPPPISAGRLRVEARIEPGPLITQNELWRGAQMLLYAHEALLVIPDLEQLFMFTFNDAARADLRTALRHLVLIRPLVEQGIVHFADPGELGPSAERVFAAESRLFEDVRTPGALDVHRSVELAVRWPQLVTPLLHSAWAYDRAERILGYLWGQGKPSNRMRAQTASRLAVLRIPCFDEAFLADIVALRQSEEVFYDWRQALERALNMLPESHGQPLGPEDTEIVTAELEPVIERMERQVKSSGFISRLRVGATAFVLGAVPAGIPAAVTSGDVMTGLWTAAGAGVTSTASVAMGARARRKRSSSQRAAIALVGAFRCSG